MKKQLHKLRRFFARGKKLNAATAREAASSSYEEEDNSSRLSGAFVVVLVLHVIALVGVFFFSRAKDRNPGPLAGKTNVTSPLAAPVESPVATPTNPPKVAAQTAPPAATPARDTEHPARSLPTPMPVTQPVKYTPEPKPSSKSSESPATEKSAPSFYIVKKGDTLVKIARQHGVSYEELSKLNKIADPKKIQLNQKLKLPKKN